VLDPGVPTHPLYRDLGTRICTFEGPWTAYQSWDGDGVRPGDGHIAHGVPTALLTAARRLMGRRTMGRCLMGRRTMGRRTMGRRTMGRRLMGRRRAGFGPVTDASPYVSAYAAGHAAG